MGVRKVAGIAAQTATRSLSSSSRARLARPLDNYATAPKPQLHSISSQVSLAFDLLNSTAHTPIKTLLSQLSERGMKDLCVGLVYESTPDRARAVNVSENPSDEVLLVAHIAKPDRHSGLADRVSLCAGFAVAADGNDSQPLVVSCVHTLNSMKSAIVDVDDDTTATLLISYENGSIVDVRYAEAIESSQPMSDLVYYKPSASIFGNGRKMRTLPVNPYPPPPGTKVAVWRPPRTPQDRAVWTHGSIDRYTTPNAKLAHIGSYDHLAHVEINDAIPRHGASGSPVIETESGAVCAIVKGAISTFPKTRGWGTPAERVWECFDLPGLNLR